MNPDFDDFFDVLDEELTMPPPNQLFQNVQSPIPPGGVPPLQRYCLNSLTANNVSTRNRRYSHRYLPARPGGILPQSSMYRRYNAYDPYNMNLDGYGLFNSYEQPITNQYQNPHIKAAAENARPAFESIQSIVQSVNAVSQMLGSTTTAMHVSFQALLSVAEHFSDLRPFMMKLYSTFVSFKLVRWFLTKLIYLIRMVKGDRGTNYEDFLSSLSPTAQEEVVPSVGRSWPLVVFTGLLVAVPYFVHKVLNTVVTKANSGLLMNNTNASVSGHGFVFESPNDWNSPKPKTIPLVKGQKYWTSNSKLQKSLNSGWLQVRNENGQSGFVPLKMFSQSTRKNNTLSPSQPKLLEENPNAINEVKVSTGSQQKESQDTTTPITNANGNPIISPDPPMASDPLKNNTK